MVGLQSSNGHVVSSKGMSIRMFLTIQVDVESMTFSRCRRHDLSPPTENNPAIRNKGKVTGIDTGMVVAY